MRPRIPRAAAVAAVVSQSTPSSLPTSRRHSRRRPRSHARRICYTRIDASPRTIPAHRTVANTSITQVNVSLSSRAGIAARSRDVLPAQPHAPCKQCSGLNRHYEAAPPQHLCDRMCAELLIGRQRQFPQAATACMPCVNSATLSGGSRLPIGAPRPVERHAS
eukprot:6175443-Pleurochrysis_carterae.AAC.1